MAGHDTMTTASTALRKSGPSAATTAIARRIVGDREHDVRAAHYERVHPPAEESGQAAMIAPIGIASATNSTASGIETRAP